jgi:hypothetical protein
MYSHLSYFQYIAAISATQKMKTFSRHAGPRSSACGVVLYSAA